MNEWPKKWISVGRKAAHTWSSAWGSRFEAGAQCSSRDIQTRVEMFMCLCQRAGSYFL